MPFINTNGYEAWQILQNAVSSGVFSNPDGLLLPVGMSLSEKIVLAEMSYQEAVNNGTDLNLLRQYNDFTKLAGNRRPEPTRDQWLWLYKNIGIRHQDVLSPEIIETFETVNCYGISPSDIWYWYRQGMKR